MKTFIDLVRSVNADPTDGKSLQALSTAIAFSVLKKCIDVSSDRSLEYLRRELASVTGDLSGIEFLTGDLEIPVSNKQAEKALSALIKKTVGDSLDLVHAAVCALLEEIQAQRERDPDLPVDLERVYTKRELSKKVWIKVSDSVGAWKEVETSPIREAFRSVRRYIATSATVSTDPGSGYTYIEDLSSDPESDLDSVIYRRLKKYTDIGGYVLDYNGLPTVYTADPESVEDLDSMIDRLSLTIRQKKILDLRLSGYGYKAVATYLSIRPESVRDALKAIQKKAQKAGLDLDHIPVERVEKSKSEKAPDLSGEIAIRSREPFWARVDRDFLTLEERKYLYWLQDHEIFNK